MKDLKEKYFARKRESKFTERTKKKSLKERRNEIK